MHRYDPEIIAALADGSLDPTRAAELEVQIAADPAASAELAQQRAALSAIHSVAHPRLTDDERTMLRASIARQLHLETAPVVQGAPRRKVAWGALGVAAATLVALVAAVPIAGLLTTGGDDGGDLTLAEAVTTFAVADETGADGATGDAPAPAVDSNDGLVVTGAPENTVTASADSTVVEETTTTMAASSLERSFGFDLTGDLLLLKSDPEALAVLSASVEESTACRVEAEVWLGSTELAFFPYAGPTDPDDTTAVAQQFVVYYLITEDPAAIGLLVAFAVDDCSDPTEIP